MDLDICVADHYLQQQRIELDWIRYALRNWQLEEKCRRGIVQREPVRGEHYQMVCNCWLNAQALYHSRTARLRNDYHILFEFGIGSTFALSKSEAQELRQRLAAALATTQNTLPEGE